MNDALRDVAALVLRESGVALRDSQLPALDAAVRRVAGGMDAEALLAAAGEPGAGEVIVERLIDEVTVKETYFLRHREELQAIDWKALAAQALTAGRPAVRVWSAACASGEEPYSLALLALEAFAPGQPPVDILATDIAHSALDRARAGRYGSRSVRHVDDELRRRWFAEHAKGLAVGDCVRSLVRFEHHNLVRDPIPPAGERAFDLVVCRNVLIYFRPDAVRETIARLRGALAPGGIMILGAADRLTGGPDAVPPPTVERPPAPPVRRRWRPARPRRAPRTDRERPAAAPAAASAEALDAAADLERGMTALAEGAAGDAVDALRRALYLDPTNPVTAFQLARAHEAREDAAAARRAYWQTLALLDAAGEIVGGVARRDLESAARARLDALGGG